MKIGIIGTGYVGLVSSVCLASSGHKLVCIDKRDHIIDALKKGIPTIYEKDMDVMLKKVVNDGGIVFSCNYQELLSVDVVFLAVGTPSLPNGHADLSQVFSAIDSLLPIISDETMIVIRSTVPVGTVSRVREYLDQKNRRAQLLGFCPEFLREGVAIADFLNPQCLVFASEHEKGLTRLQEVYQPIVDKLQEQRKDVKIVCTKKFETAELIKYTINSFLATKITFINQIAQLAQVAGAEIDVVVEAIGADSRIGSQFLIPGPGFGGSCFPKDTIALVKCGIGYGVDMSVVEEVNHANQRHKEYIASWILETLEGNMKLEGVKVAVWGLAFKAGTDDVRDSAALTIVKSLFERGLYVNACDPKGNENFKQQVNNAKLQLFDSPLEAVQDTDVLIVLTEWSEFAGVDIDEVTRRMGTEQPYVFDTRGVLNMDEYASKGFRVFKFGM